MKKSILLSGFAVLVLCLAGQSLAAEESRELSLQLSTLPEAKLLFTQRYIFPFLEGNTPLTEENNIGLSLTAEIAPVSINGVVEVIWTPIAFFQLSAGGRIGSGWKINFFGDDIYGIGINRAGDGDRAEHSGSAFDGLLWKAQIGATLQFDLAAVFPGDWNHVVARTYHEINYAGYTAAARGESWYFENDLGENINGFNYYGNLFIGYQMPLILDTIGLLTEAELKLYDTPCRSQWGDDKIWWIFSLLGNFAFTNTFSTAILIQFNTERNFTEINWDELYYQKRNLDHSNPIRLAFYRAALVVTYKF